MSVTDPWGLPVVAMVPYEHCAFVAPNNLPCTSNANDHPGLHFTSDGRAWNLDEEKS